MAAASGNRRRDAVCAALLLAWLAVHRLSTWRKLACDTDMRGLLESADDFEGGPLVSGSPPESMAAWDYADPRGRRDGFG